MGDTNYYDALSKGEVGTNMLSLLLIEQLYGSHSLHRQRRSPIYWTVQL